MQNNKYNDYFKQQIKLFKPYNNLFFELYAIQQMMLLYNKKGIKIVLEALKGAIKNSDQFIQRDFFRNELNNIKNL